MTEQETAQVLRKKYSNNVEVRTAEVRASDGDGLMIEGYAAVFDQVTNIGPFQEVIDRGAFEGHLNDDVRLLLNHDGAPMARTTNNTLTLTTDDHGLHYRATLVDTQASRDLYAMIKRQDISQSSFAFTIEKEERQSDGVRRVMKVGTILDVSPVTAPAYPTTNVVARSAVMEQVTTEKEQKQTKTTEMDLTLKDLLNLREEYMQKRQSIKDDAIKEDRDLNDSDVREMERLADEVSKFDRKIKVLREDQKLAESAIIAGGNTASSGERREMNKLAQRYSLVRGIQQVYRGRPLTGLEAEMTEEANREARAAGLTFRGQLSIPSSMLEKRGVGDVGHWGATDTANDHGTQFVGTNVGAAIEALRAETTLQQAGITVLNGLTADLRIPRMTAGATIAEKGEAADAATSGQALGSTLLQPRRASAFTLVTEQLMMQGGQAVESLVIRDLADAVNAKIENLAFIDILDGIAGASNNVETALGATSSVVQGLVRDCLIDGVSMSNVAIVANPRAHGTLVSHTDVVAVTAALQGNTYSGYPYYVAGQCPDDATATNEYGGGVVIAGDFARGAVMGLFGGVDFVINPYTYDISNQVRISVHRHFDTDVLQAGALHARYEVGG